MCQTRERVLRDGQEDTATPLLLSHFFPWKAIPCLQSFTCSLPEASTEQPAELDGENEGKIEGRTKAELHRDYGGSAVGISPVEIHISSGSQVCSCQQAAGSTGAASPVPGMRRFG